ncbi:AraC family transcriptional regulator [Paenibacillus hodogayensis]|uniref:AraC family transcriptional regulator n=1 Tax=Paenibacillus hodogayensis TaxID=279208 RepID=A0ABV5VUS2_9BACL
MNRLIPFPFFKQYNYRFDIPYKFEFDVHPQYEIYYFHSGVCNYVIGDQVYDLQPGDMIIMHGMTRHQPKVDDLREYVRSMISFEPSIIQMFEQQVRSLNPLSPFEKLKNFHIRLNKQSQSEVEDILSRIDCFYGKEDIVCYHRFLTAFYDLLLFIYDKCRSAMEECRSVSSSKEWNVQRIVAYIENRFMDEINLDQMAKELHMSKYYVSKLFRSVTGMTIFDFIIQRRINEARILILLGGPLSVTDVCYQVGFKNPTHFSRRFKEQIGLSPAQFRKKVGS